MQTKTISNNYIDHPRLDGRTTRSQRQRTPRLRPHPRRRIPRRLPPIHRQPPLPPKPPKLPHQPNLPPTPHRNPTNQHHPPLTPPSRNTCLKHPYNVGTLGLSVRTTKATPNVGTLGLSVRSTTG